MCGIAGLQIDRREGYSVVLERILDRLPYRGPDDRGEARTGSWHIGMVRLAIQDPALGHQPMRSADGRWLLVLNGEIYNFRQLRASLLSSGATLRTRSDTEVLLELLAQRGVVHALEAIEGMFAFAAVDTLCDELWLARDRFGEKPLFVDRRDGGFAFCSEITPLLKARPLPRRVSVQGLVSILRFGFPSPGSTAVTGITELRPGEWLCRRSSGEESAGFYWRPPDTIDEEAGSLERAGAKLLDLLHQSVRDRLLADVPLGIFLSGGIDSGAVAQAAVVTRPDIEAVTVGFEDATHDERPLARASASFLGVKLHEEQAATQDFSRELADDLLIHYGQPFADSSAVPTRVASRAARRHFKVVLSGDGGDELLCGYPSYQRQRLFSRWGGGRLGSVGSGWLAKRVPNWGYWETTNRVLTLNHGIAKGLFAYASDGVFSDAQVLDLFEGTEYKKEAAAQLEASREQARSLWLTAKDPTLALSLHQLSTSLPQDMLMKMDRLSMAESLEVRSPFLDSRLATFALSLPAHMKLSGRLGKFILRRALRHRLPESVLRARKHGFMLPLHSWLGPDFWQELGRELIRYGSDSAAELNPTALFRQVTLDQERCQRANSYRAIHRVWLVYTFLRWRDCILHTNVPAYDAVFA